MAIKQTIFNYAGSRYLWISLAICVLSIAIYSSHGIDVIPNGGSWQGYVLGTLAAILIICLSLLGIRKRSYRSNMGSVQGWTSAHIYLGLSLLLIASLHCGFQFAWNVHTYAYILMVLVIFSGVLGLILYAMLPRKMIANRSGLSRIQLLENLDGLESEVVEALEGFSKEIQSLVISAIQYTDQTQSLFKIVFFKDQSKVADINAFDKFNNFKLIDNSGQKKLLEYLAHHATVSNNSLKSQALVELLAQRAVLLEKLRKDSKSQTLLQTWLFIHIPLTFALLVTLTAHIFSVFYYW